MTDKLDQNRKLIIMGMMGSGKTTMARMLSNSLALDYLDLDAYLEASTGQRVSEVFSQGGEAHFRELEHAALKEVLAIEGNLILALGGGTPCFERNRLLLKPADLTVYLKYSAAQLADHLEYQTDDRPILSSSEKSLSSTLQDLLTLRADWYEQANVILDGTGGNAIDRELFHLAKDFFSPPSRHKSM